MEISWEAKFIFIFKIRRGRSGIDSCFQKGTDQWLSPPASLPSPPIYFIADTHTPHHHHPFLHLKSVWGEGRRGCKTGGGPMKGEGGRYEVEDGGGG